MTDFFIFFENS